MHTVDFYCPNSASELVKILQDTDARIIAGCTDILPRARQGRFQADCLVDISRIKELRYIREADNQIQIGALVTHTDMADSALLQDAAPALVQAAVTVGCPQTRNRGTLGGNLSNASPAADSAPPLLVLDAHIQLVGSQGHRIMPLADFFQGPGQTALTRGEYVERVSFDRPSGRWGSTFLKLGKRSGMAISIVSVAVWLDVAPDGAISTARVAMGSVAPMPVRSQNAEVALIGKTPSLEVFRIAGQAALQDISPIDDLRASAEYREHATSVLVERALNIAWGQAESR